MAGEVLAHVQGESLKANAAVRGRFSNSPATSPSLVAASREGSEMDQPYNAFADWLSKFHTASEPIQALWIVALAAVAIAFIWSITVPFRLRLARRDGERPHLAHGELVCGLYRNDEGRLMFYADGEESAAEQTSEARLAWRLLDQPEPSLSPARRSPMRSRKWPEGT